VILLAAKQARAHCAEDRNGEGCAQVSRF